MLVSVIVATINRPHHLQRCIEAILLSSYTNFEIVVIDQSNMLQGFSANHFFTSKKIVYMHVKQKGKTRALNTGIKAARGNICAFTDDDCIPDTKWLENIVHIFRTNPMISGVFGRTLPYRPNLHPNLICPCTFNKPQKRIITKPHRHWEDIGFGNNMAFKKATLEKIGLFKTWLGPGSVDLIVKMVNWHKER